MMILNDDSPTNLHFICEQTLNSEGLAERDLSLKYVYLPHVIHHLTPEVPAERSLVAQEGCTYQTITQETNATHFQFLQVVCPAAHRNTHKRSSGELSNKEYH